MRRRIETKLVWDFEKFDSTLGRNAGVPTTLPVPSRPKGDDPPRVREVMVGSRNGSTEGYVVVTLDKGIEEGPLDDTAVAVGALFGKWYREHVTSGRGGTGRNSFTQDFELSRKEHSFCDKAVVTVLLILKSLGVKREAIPDPVVTQSTRVWVPKKRGWTDLNSRREYGWVDYGRWLANRFKLNEHERSYPIYD